jgi:hypothetical protein
LLDGVDLFIAERIIVRGVDDDSLSGKAGYQRCDIRDAISVVTASAPEDKSSLSIVSGPREFATFTSCPAWLKRTTSVLPMFPVPKIPIFIFPPIDDYCGVIIWTNFSNNKNPPKSGIHTKR